METKTREIIVSLAMDLRAWHLRAETYKALLESIEENPEMQSRWRSYAERMIAEPDVAANELIGAQIQPFIDYALEGLCQTDAQALLDRIGRMHANIQ